MAPARSPGRICSLALVAGLGFTYPAAGFDQPPDSSSEQLAEDWQRRLAETNQELLDHKWRKGRRSLDRLIEEMREQLVGGAGVGMAFSRALILRAVSQAGLGEEREARWDYAMARELFPPVAQMDLTPYGSSTEVLRSDPYEQPTSGVVVNQDFRPPEVIRSPRPEYPFAQRISCLEQPIQVRAIVGSNGVPHSPKLLTRENLVLGFAAMDALREWRFRPASVRGKPIVVTYSLTVTFSIPICSP